MADRVVRIRIKSDADLKGLKQAGFEIDETEEAVAELTKRLEALEAQMTRTESGLKKTSSGAKGAKAETSKLAGGALEASRAFEDLQYGIRGVLNNIPVMIQRFGGGAGLAAAISFAAVSADLLVRRLTQTEDKAEDTSGKMRDLQRATEEMEEAMNDALSNIERDYDGSISAADQLIDRQKTLARIAQQQDDAEAVLAIAAIDKSDADEIDKIRARAEVAIEAQQRRTERARGANRDNLQTAEDLLKVEEKRKDDLANEIRVLEDRKRLTDEILRLEIEGGDRETIDTLKEVAEAAGVDEAQLADVEQLTKLQDTQRKNIKGLRDDFVKLKQPVQDARKALQLAQETFLDQQGAIDTQEEAALAKIDANRQKQEDAELKRRQKSLEKGINERAKARKKAAEDEAKAEEALFKTARSSARGIEGLLGQRDFKFTSDQRERLSGLATRLVERGGERGELAELESFLAELDGLLKANGGATIEAVQRVSRQMSTITNDLGSLNAKLQSLGAEVVGGDAAIR